MLGIFPNGTVLSSGDSDRNNTMFLGMDLTRSDDPSNQTAPKSFARVSIYLTIFSLFSCWTEGSSLIIVVRGFYISNHFLSFLIDRSPHLGGFTSIGS